MKNKIILTAATVLALIAAPAFSDDSSLAASYQGDDQTVDCFYEANAGNPACAKPTDSNG